MNVVYKFLSNYLTFILDIWCYIIIYIIYTTLQLLEGSNLQGSNYNHSEKIKVEIFDLKHTRFETYKIWNIQDLEHTRIGTHKIWNIQDLEHTRFKTYKIWNIQDLKHTRFEK